MLCLIWAIFRSNFFYKKKKNGTERIDSSISLESIRNVFLASMVPEIYSLHSEDDKVNNL